MSLKSMQSNIKHVVHLMLENRSFDSVLGWLRWKGVDRPPNNVPSLRPGESPFYGLSGTEWQPSNASYFLSQGPFTYEKLPVFKIKPGDSWDHCEMPPDDPGEEYQHVYVQIFGPYGVPPVDRRMKGFYIDYVAVNDPRFTSPKDILAVFSPETLPCINTLAENYAVSDMWFSSVPTQTNPNRAFSLCGTSLGRINNNDDVNTYKLCGEPYAGINTVFSVFNAFNARNPNLAPIRWKLYADYNWHNVSPDLLGWKFWHDAKLGGSKCFDATKGKYYTQYMFPKGFDDLRWGGFGSVDHFERDVKNGSLPDFAYIEPVFFPQSVELTKLTDYHPPESVFYGERFLKRIFEILSGNQSVWEKTLLIVTFDEHGGTFDHVLPPSNAVRPDDNTHPLFNFTRYGVRVPTLLVSPWVSPGTVFRAGYYPEVNDPARLPFDHTSMLATLCKWKGIGYTDPSRNPDYYLGARTASAPTFEDVITDVKNSVIPKLVLHDCSVGFLGLVRRRELVDAVGNKVSEIAGRTTDDPAHSKIVGELLQSCRTEEDVIRALDDLGKKDTQPRE